MRTKNRIIDPEITKGMANEGVLSGTIEISPIKAMPDEAKNKKVMTTQ